MANNRKLLEAEAELLKRKSVPQPDVGFGAHALRTFDDVVRSVASGATFDMADEFSAYMSSVTGVGGFPDVPSDYESQVAAQRQRDEEISPYIRIPGQIAGGLGAAVALGPAAAVAAGEAGLSQLGARLPGWLKAAGLGGLFGGAYGAGAAEGGLEERAVGAGTGAALGAGTGAIAYPIVKGVQTAGSTAWDAVAARWQPREAAYRKTAEAIARDEMTPGRIEARIRNLGPQATIADAGGENMLGLARSAAGVPGVARNRASQVLEGRVTTEGERIAKVVGRELDPKDFYAAEEAFLSNLRQRAAPLYEKAYRQNTSIMTPRLKRLLTSRAGQRALKETAAIVENERAAGAAKYLGAVDDELTQAARDAASVGKMESVGRPGVIKGFSLETWDQIKRGFDSLLDSPAYRNEITGKLNQKGRSIDQMRRTLLKELDSATGGEKSVYAKARSVYRGDIEAVEALRQGRKILSLDPEIIKKQLGELSEAGQEAYRTGAARAIKDVVDKTQDTAGTAKKLFGTARNRARFREIFPDRESFNIFAKNMIAEMQFAKTRNVVLGGSQTAPRLAERADLVSELAGSIGAVAGTQVPGTHALVASGLGRKLGQAIFGPGGDIEKELSKILFSRNQAANKGVIDELLRLTRSGKATQQQLSRAGRMVLQAVAQQEGLAAGGMQGP